jgi:hypothetical protein
MFRLSFADYGPSATSQREVLKSAYKRTPVISCVAETPQYDPKRA